MPKVPRVDIETNYKFRIELDEEEAQLLSDILKVWALNNSQEYKDFMTDPTTMTYKMQTWATDLIQRLDPAWHE